MPTIQNVDLATGTLSLPISLIHEPGPNGLDIDVGILYSSRIRDAVTAWNNDVPTDILGLGWSLPRAFIARDTKSTGTPSDDTYYLILDGTYELVQIGRDGDVLTFATTPEFQPWQIVYNTAQEEWRITQQNGICYTFGGGVTADAAGRHQSLGDSIQWGVKWGNWIGSSSQGGGEQLPLVWDLASVRNPYGQTLNYKYTQTVIPVGTSAGPGYTQASYLSRITTGFGDFVAFSYQNKEADELPDVASPAGTPSVEQERVQKQYLAGLAVYRAADTANPCATVQLDYRTLNSGPMKKRLLTGITTFRRQTPVDPGIRFAYYGESADDGVSAGITYSVRRKFLNPDTGAMFGALKSIVSPNGGITRYKYGQVTLVGTQRALRNIVPRQTLLDKHNQPLNLKQHIYFGPDYVVITWSDDTHLLLDIYQWQGKWSCVTPQPQGVFVLAKDKKHVVAPILAGDFVALVTPEQSSSLILFHKDAVHPSRWGQTTIALKLTADAQVDVGENFVAIIDKRLLHRYVWDGAAWAAVASNPVLLDLNTSARFGLAAAGNVLCVVSGRADGSSSQDTLRLFYLDAMGTWTQNVLKVDPYFTNAPGYTNNECTLTLRTGGTFAALEVLEKRYNEYSAYSLHYHKWHYQYRVYQWDTGYMPQELKLGEQDCCNVDRSAPNLFALDSIVWNRDNQLSFTAFGSQIGIDAVPITYWNPAAEGAISPTGHRRLLFRFDGRSWRRLPELKVYQPNDFYGLDVTVEVLPSSLLEKNTLLRQYDLRTGRWVDPPPVNFKSPDQLVKQLIWDVGKMLIAGIVTLPLDLVGGEVVGAVIYQALSYALTFSEGFAARGLSGQRYLTVIDSKAGSGALYYKGENGNWMPAANSSAFELPLMVTGKASYGYSVLALSDRLVLWQLKRTQEGRRFAEPEIASNYAAILRNGGVYLLASLERGLPRGQAPSETTAPAPEQPILAGSGMFATYPATKKNFTEAKSLNLYYLADDEIEGAVQGYVVTQVDLADGYQTVNTFFDYDAGDAALAPATFTPIYGQVAVAIGGDSFAAAKQAGGWTQYCFYTGAASAPPIAPAASNFCNVQEYPAVAAGRLYQQCAFGADQADPAVQIPTPTELEITEWSVFEKGLNATGSRVSYLVQPLRTTATVDGVQTVIETTYDAPRSRTDRNMHTGAVTSTKLYTVSAGDQQEEVIRAYTYAWQQYDAMKKVNMLLSLAMVQQTRRFPAQAGSSFVESATCTTWQAWPDGTWAPAAVYQWRGQGDPTFNAWDGSNAGDDWLQTAEMVSYQQGVLTEQKNALGASTSWLYDKDLVLPIGAFNNASLAGREVVYTGFEAYEDISAWTRTNADEGTDGAITAYLDSSGAYTGELCLRLDPGTGIQAHDLASAAANQPAGTTARARVFAAGVYYKTATGFGGQQGTGGVKLVAYRGTPQVAGTWEKYASLQDTGGQWQYAELVMDLAVLGQVVSPGEGTVVIDLVVENRNYGAALWIDEVRFAPVAAPAVTKVYDPGLRTTTATLDTNATTIRYLLDKCGRVMGAIAPNRQVQWLQTSTWSRQAAPDGLAFEPLLPNSLLVARPQAGAGYYDFMYDLSDMGGGTVVGGALTLQNGVPVTVGEIPASGGIYLQLQEWTSGTAGGEQQGTAVLSIGLGSAALSYDYMLQQYTLAQGGTQIGQPVPCAPGRDLVLLAVGSSLLVYADGRQVIATAALQQPEILPVQLTVQWADTLTPLQVYKIGLMAAPQIEAFYSDGAGRIRQTQTMEDGAQVIAAEVLYDRQGRRTFETVPVRKGDGATYANLPGFELGLVGGRDPASGANLWSTDGTNSARGVMTGQIQAWLASEFSTQYPYTGRIYEQNPLARPAWLVGLDADFMAGASHATHFQYGINDQAKQLLQQLEIPEGDYGNYTCHTTFIPLGNSQQLTAVQIATNEGHRVVDAAVDPDGRSRVRSYTTTYRAAPAQTIETTAEPLYFQPRQGEDGQPFEARCVYNELGLPVEMDTPDTGTTRLVYDQLGRLRFKMDAAGADRQPNLVLYYLYDDLDRLIEAGFFEADWDDNLLQEAAYGAWPDSLPAGTALRQLQYDYRKGAMPASGFDAINCKGRLVQEVVRTLADPSDATGTTDAAVITQSYIYDMFGRIVGHSTTAGGFDGLQYTTQYAYDQQGRVTSIAYPAGAPSADQAAGAARVPLAAGPQSAPLNAGERVGPGSAMVYHAGSDQSATIGTQFEQPLQVQVFDVNENNTANATVTFTVVAVDGGAGATFVGSNTAQALTDADGIATSPPLIANGTAGYFRVHATVLGLPYYTEFILFNVPSFSTITYTYNLLGQVIGVGLPGDQSQMSVAGYAYHANGAIAAEYLNRTADGTRALLTRAYSYNALGLLVGITDDQFFTQQLTYANDQGEFLDGNIQRIDYGFAANANFGSTRPTAYTQRYRYDAFGQLVQVQASEVQGGNITIGQPINGQTRGGYDANGNLLRVQDGSGLSQYTYSAGTNQLASILTQEGQSGSTGSFGYRKSGEVSRSPATANLTYDLLRGLPCTLAMQNGDQISYRYGGAGERVLKIVNKSQDTTKKLYLCGVGMRPLLECAAGAAGNSTQVNYIYGPTGLVAVHSGATTYYLCKDHLGSSRVVFDSGKTVAAYFNYEPFGELMAENSQAANADWFTRRFTGQEYERETGLYNYGARLYDSAVGRFYMPDPAWESASPYLYVGNNPINATDPTGKLFRAAAWTSASAARASRTWTAQSLRFPRANLGSYSRTGRLDVARNTRTGTVDDLKGLINERGIDNLGFRGTADPAAAFVTQVAEIHRGKLPWQIAELEEGPMPFGLAKRHGEIASTKLGVSWARRPGFAMRYAFDLNDQGIVTKNGALIVFDNEGLATDAMGRELLQSVGDRTLTEFVVKDTLYAERNLLVITTEKELRRVLEWLKQHDKPSVLGIDLRHRVVSPFK